MTSSGPLRLALFVLAALIAAAALLVRAGDPGPGREGRGLTPGPAAAAKPARPPAYAAGAGPVQVHVRFRRPPRSALLFDLRSGAVLWSHAASRRQPIASLAKMMTAIVVADRSGSGEEVLITPEAKAEPGSAVGLLPPGRRVRLETLLYGLLLPSGNDAAVALAQHVSGSVPAFVDEMNAHARRLGLGCSHFSSPDGYEDRGNVSCARDLAVLAREVLARPRLARIVGTAQASFPALLPKTVKRHKRKLTVWRPGRLWLSNNNPLLRADYPGTTGIKTGYTDAAGRCLVATVRRRGRTLGVVMLHSFDPGYQAKRLLEPGFRALRLGRVRSAAPASR